MTSGNEIVWDMGELTPTDRDSSAPSEPSGGSPDRSTLALLVGLLAAIAVVAFLLPTGTAAPAVLEEEAAAPEPSTTPTPRPERVAAEEFLRGNLGVAMSLCNAMAKYFDETPKQVERARRYAGCLEDFEIPFRLPTTEIHQAYGIPADTEPAVLLRCGEVLSGPDISQAAWAEYELCADEAEEVFGLT